MGNFARVCSTEIQVDEGEHSSQKKFMIFVQIFQKLLLVNRKRLRSMLVRFSLKFIENQIIENSAGLMSLQLSAETFDSLPEPTKKAIEKRIGLDKLRFVTAFYT